MRFRDYFRFISGVFLVLSLAPYQVAGQAAQQTTTQTSQQSAASQIPRSAHEPTPADILRGAYGPYRANNDLLYYHLDVRVDPDKKFISGKNNIRFKMLQDGKRIQLDLQQPLQIDKILLGITPLKYERQFGAVFIDFPETLRAGHTYSIDFYYSGNPKEQGRFGGFSFHQDPEGHPWIFTACEGIGATRRWRRYLRKR